MAIELTSESSRVPDFPLGYLNLAGRPVARMARSRMCLARADIYNMSIEGLAGTSSDQPERRLNSGAWRLDVAGPKFPSAGSSPAKVRSRYGFGRYCVGSSVGAEPIFDVPGRSVGSRWDVENPRPVAAHGAVNLTQARARSALLRSNFRLINLPWGCLGRFRGTSSTLRRHHSSCRDRWLCPRRGPIDNAHRVVAAEARDAGQSMLGPDMGAQGSDLCENGCCRLQLRRGSSSVWTGAGALTTRGR